MLIELHLIQNHAPSNLNRDDTGTPKEALFGGVMRARISSQCLKRSVRRSDLFQSAFDAGHLASRSRQIGTRLLPHLKSLGCDDAVAKSIMQKATGLGSGKCSNAGEFMTRQTMFLAEEEIARLARQLLAIHDRDPAAFEKLEHDALEKELEDRTIPRSVDIALSGRMTTSAAFEDVTAALQVAHAISTGKVERQLDYYTAVDDLASAGDLGADMIGDIEFNSATYYKYFSLDWRQFLENLGGDREIARQAVRAFLMAATLTTPTGKQNSFAAHNPPDAVFAEVKRQRIPIHYGNAFVKPVRPHGDHDLVAASILAFTEYAERLRSAYGIEGQGFWLTTRSLPFAGMTTVNSLEELTCGVLQAIEEGK
jgi:CRISPR system Cascade subunit CasC